MEDRRPLVGYKVLDFTQFVAGAAVTSMMAEMGAEVIKVEVFPGGDPTRTWPEIQKGRSGYFVQHNRGKQSLCIDVKNPDGIKVLKQLVPKVDVVVENYTPGVMKRMGLDYGSLKPLNSKLVMCSVSAFGQEGPLALEAGFDYSGAGYAGLLDLIGQPDGPPVIIGAAAGDVSTAVHAYGAIVTALLYRERSGRGQYLDISLLDSYFHFHESSVQRYTLSKGEVKARRIGGHASYVAPAGIYKSPQGYIIIFAQLEHMWKRLCKAMGQTELAADIRFSTNADRARNLKELVQVIEGWMATMPDDASVIATFREYKIPYAPVLKLEEAINHPHLKQRHTVRTIRDRVLGEYQIPGFPLRFSEVPELPMLDAPFLGEHNQEVLEKFLGYSREQVQALIKQGVLLAEKMPGFAS